MPKLSRISIVLATWCPHCVPLSLEYANKSANNLGVPLRVLDIDKAEALETADILVANFGDNAEDYIIPQVFAEFEDGSVKHIFTGFSENTEVTKKHWEDFFSSKFYSDLKRTNA
jgi:thiol-disulfide isomerase/thioredoxin